MGKNGPGIRPLGERKNTVLCVHAKRRNRGAFFIRRRRGSCFFSQPNVGCWCDFCTKQRKQNCVERRSEGNLLFQIDFLGKKIYDLNILHSTYNVHRRTSGSYERNQGGMRQ